MTPRQQSIKDANDQYPSAGPTTLARLIIQNRSDLWGVGHAAIENVRRAVGKYRKSISHPKPPPVQKTEDEMLNDRREEINHRQEAKRIQTLQDEVLRLRSKIETINNVFAPDMPPIVPTHGKSQSETVAIAAASDWHVEEVVDPKTVNGMNEYSAEMADLRSELFFIKILKLVDLWRAGTRINKLVLALLGDFITGVIHDENKKTNEMLPMEACSYAFGLLKKGVNLLLNHGKFDEILIPCLVGNHGRTTEKPTFGTRVKENYELAIYTQLAYEFKSAPVKIIAPTGHLQMIDIFGRMIRFHHGDSIKYRDGVGGLTIPANKRIANWNRSGVMAYLDIFGHHHTELPSDRFYANGSMIGYNSYAAGNALPYQPACQTLLYIEKDHGLTNYSPLWLS